MYVYFTILKHSLTHTHTQQSHTTAHNSMYNDHLLPVVRINPSGTLRIFFSKLARPIVWVDFTNAAFPLVLQKQRSVHRKHAEQIIYNKNLYNYM
jgi:hypothetical protein